MQHGSSGARSLVRKHHCLFCHNSDFSGHENVPRLAGQREDYLLKALLDFKSNTRPGYDASMAEVVRPISEAELADLAYLMARARGEFRGLLHAHLKRPSRHRHAHAYRNAHVDQNKVPNNLLVKEPSLSTQGIGGSCGR
jgi:hypothetical protein